MTIDAALLDLLPDTVNIAPYSSIDQHGTVTYGANVEYQARVEGRVRMVRDPEGNERVSTVTVYLASSPGISPKDRLTLPAGYTPSQPRIIAVERMPDENGAYYEAVYS